MDSTNPSPKVLRAARNARMFSVAGVCSCASGPMARSLTMDLPVMVFFPSLNDLHLVSTAVVEAARDSLVIGPG
jgi:hypothetical protein